jgi:hypothetical protein
MVARSRRSAKAAGSRTERAVADYLAAALDDDRIDRRVKTGRADRGDIGGVRVHGKRLVIEAKDCARLDFPGWIREAHIEAGNDDALCGVVVAKRRGTTDPGSFYAVMELRDLVALITGQPQDGRYE